MWWGPDHTPGKNLAESLGLQNYGTTELRILFWFLGGKKSDSFEMRSTVVSVINPIVHLQNFPKLPVMVRNPVSYNTVNFNLHRVCVSWLMLWQMGGDKNFWSHATETTVLVLVLLKLSKISGYPHTFADLSVHGHMFPFQEINPKCTLYRNFGWIVIVVAIFAYAPPEVWDDEFFFDRSLENYSISHAFVQFYTTW